MTLDALYLEYSLLTQARTKREIEWKTLAENATHMLARIGNDMPDRDDLKERAAECNHRLEIAMRNEE